MQTPTLARLHSPRRRPKEGGDYRLAFLSCTPWRVVKAAPVEAEAQFRLKDRLEASARASARRHGSFRGGCPQRVTRTAVLR
jgi:hypothetical protein